jgi:2-polyprenyl-6-methoxyphenol hydroxylase-like FAD-dependent oxidoreductase
MNVIIIGAGPTGLTLGAALARRGAPATVVDPDPGPARDGSWPRRGVMQFGHAHGFRHQVLDLLQAEWPEAWTSWQELGAEPVPMRGMIEGAAPVGVRSRRSTYERALRRAAATVEGLSVVAGRVERLAEANGRVAGAVIDGAIVGADLVVDASGRLSRFAPPVGISGDTGMTYLNRTYRRRPDAPPGPMNGPVAWYGALAGYDAYVFPHERGHISVVLTRPTADRGLLVLRHEPAFEAACRAIPGVAGWVEGSHVTPTSGVMLGGSLVNLYRRQHDRPGLVTIGDAVATTAPTAGRGVAMASLQIGALLHLLDAGADPATIAQPFGQWCDRWVRPWVEDHLANDAETLRRWHGQNVDLDGPVSSAAIVAAALADPRIGGHLDGYLAMTELPSSLAPAEVLARSVYRSGWRLPVDDGPTRDELVALGRMELAARAA